MKPFTTEPLRWIGAAVGDLDVDVERDDPIAPEVARALYDTWLEFGVLVFPRAGVSEEIQLALSRVFGELDVHPLEMLRVEGHEEIAPFGNLERPGTVFIVDGERIGGYLYWHQDMAYTPNLCKGAMLRMLRIPARGGDTLFCDTAKAYDELPEEWKQRIEGLETLQLVRTSPPERPWGMAGHRARIAGPDEDPADPLPQLEELPLVRHPMVVTHPESGRRSLLLSPQGYGRILGMDRDEGDALFDRIVGHALQERFCYRHTWDVHDMVLWDNRRTMHMAAGYPFGEIRVAHRTTLKEPFAAGRIFEPQAQERASATEGAPA